VLSKQDDGGAASCLPSLIAAPASAARHRFRRPTGGVKSGYCGADRKSPPYGIVFAKDAIYYSASPAKPNTIVRFEPKTEKASDLGDPGWRH
jgi:hypothetical protein